jgi:DNA polymerase (family 10)
MMTAITLPNTVSFVDSSMQKTIHKIHPSNRELAGYLDAFAAVYRYTGGKDRFRATAYAQAAETVRNLHEPIERYDTLEKLDELKGIGTHIAEKIQEYNRTGRIGSLLTAQRGIPVALFALYQLEGIGPSTIHRLADDLQIHTLDQLRVQLQENRDQLRKIVHVDKFNRLVRYFEKADSVNRMPWKTAHDTAIRLVRQLLSIPTIISIEIGGSLRRKKGTVGDIDLLIEADLPQHAAIANSICEQPWVKSVVARGTTKIALTVKKTSLPVDIRIMEPKSIGAALLYLTGSKAFNIALRAHARKKGYKINEYGLFDRDTGRFITGSTENAIFQKLDLSFIPPEQREDARILHSVTARNKLAYKPASA